MLDVSTLTQNIKSSLDYLDTHSVPDRNKWLADKLEHHIDTYITPNVITTVDTCPQCIQPVGGVYTGASVRTGAFMYTSGLNVDIKKAFDATALVVEEKGIDPSTGIPRFKFHLADDQESAWDQGPEVLSRYFSNAMHSHFSPDGTITTETNGEIFVSPDTTILHVFCPAQGKLTNLNKSLMHSTLLAGIYSPLTAEAGDDYLLPSRRVFNEFLL